MAVFPSNARAPRYSTEVGMNNIRNPVHLENEESPMRLTEVGITMLDIAVRAKTPSEILLTEVGINTQLSEEQP